MCIIQRPFEGGTMRFTTRFSFVLLSLLLLGLVAESVAQTKTKKKPRPTTRPAAAPAQPVAPVIANNTEIKIRLTSDIDTKTAQDGDKFTATVLEPSRYANATIEGHIAAVKQSGKLKGKTALSLTFDTITHTNGASAPLHAQLVKVYDTESAKKVDSEGTIESGSKTKTTTVRTGGGAAAGAAIGAIAGGGKGAAIGAIVGAVAGGASTYIQGANKIRLDRGTEILIVTVK
jgi:outer membrane lipoprotein SlyB